MHTRSIICNDQWKVCGIIYCNLHTLHTTTTLYTTSGTNWFNRQLTALSYIIITIITLVKICVWLCMLGEVGKWREERAVDKCVHNICARNTVRRPAPVHLNSSKVNLQQWPAANSQMWCLPLHAATQSIFKVNVCLDIVPLPLWQIVTFIICLVMLFEKIMEFIFFVTPLDHPLWQVANDDANNVF